MSYVIFYFSNGNVYDVNICSFIQVFYLKDKASFCAADSCELKYIIKELYCLHILTVSLKTERDKKTYEHISIEINSIILPYIHSGFNFSFLEFVRRSTTNKLLGQTMKYDCYILWFFRLYTVYVQIYWSSIVCGWGVWRIWKRSSFFNVLM